MERVDIYPTHKFSDFKLRIGKPYPFGASSVPGGINFSIFSRHAEYCTLVLFKKNSTEPIAEIPFRGIFNKLDTGLDTWVDFRVGNVFCMIVFNLDYENLEYGYRMGAPYPKAQKGQAGIHRFDPSIVLLDPYAKGISGREIWGKREEKAYTPHSRFVFDDFDWESDQPLEIPIEDLIIYEMHVRGFSIHPSSGVKYKGTFAAIHEKVSYLKKLGINCIELMPIFEFDELENSFSNPKTGEPLLNYWGYNPIGFFSPKAGYTVFGYTEDATLVSDGIKRFVKELHKEGIEVILDVVFNHTAEGNEKGPTLNFRGVDNATYYMLTPEGYYYNFSGTGNTLNCNNPIVRNLLLDCLRFWVSEYHIDGFRFDLAAVLGRDPSGKPLQNPPLLETLAYDPVLGKCKLIAEAWDASSLYQVGSFPGYERWIEWNGHYRDVVRQFLRGDFGQLGKVSQVIQGSPHLYGQRGLNTSVNFITCHDGFTLLDLFSYNQKHNLANGENNADGSNDNLSCNYGHEGPTDDPQINVLRMRQRKNAMAILMISQGIPMVLMGDEMGRTQYGNNNAYCQDNEISWLDWSLLGKNYELFNFVKQCIRFRQHYAVLKYGVGKHKTDNEACEMISWHGTEPWYVDWSDSNRSFAVMFQSFFSDDEKYKSQRNKQYFIYVVMNMSDKQQLFKLPALPPYFEWKLFANTAAKAPHDIYQVDHEYAIDNQSFFRVSDRAVVILVGRANVS